MGYLDIKFEYGFCMKSDCINYWEDNCVLCFNEDKFRGKKIYPYNLDNSLKDVEKIVSFKRRETDIDKYIRRQIELAIELLSAITLDCEYSAWVSNCIECLQFALNNEQLLIEKPELYRDTLHTLELLYLWMIDGKGWAYVNLREKFKTWYSPEQIGNSFRTILKKLENVNKNQELIGFNTENSIELKSKNGDFKSMFQILKELSEEWVLL